MLGSRAPLPFQGLHQQFRIVRYDRVNAQGCETQHLSRIIDGPCDDLLTLRMDFFNQPAGEQPIMRHHVRDGEHAPTAKLPARLRQSSEQQRAVQIMQPSHHSRKE